MAIPAGVHIGTSGWHYKHWLGPFYPEKLPASRMFEHYARHFHTVELNNSFYRLPAESAVTAWREMSPPGFCFAMKGSRYLTHMKKLKDPQAGIEKFMERADLLGSKLGPILFQLPPFWEVNLPRLEEFLETLPRHHRYAFELRNATWRTEAVYKVLRKHRAAFCIYELAGFRSDFTETTDFTYVRLHGPGGAYQGSYDSGTLHQWAERIRSWQRELHAVFVYFDNDQAGYAVHNAAELRQLVS
jgi:uncharacterized protein YecE (DUF72 family)